MKSDGLILTNAHVVGVKGHVVVKLWDGREFEGTVEHFDTQSDLATVRIKAVSKFIVFLVYKYIVKSPIWTFKI